MQEKNTSSHSCNPKLSCEAAGKDGHIPTSESLGIVPVKKEGFVGQIYSQWIAQVCSLSCVMRSRRDAG